MDVLAAPERLRAAGFPRGARVPPCYLRAARRGGAKGGRKPPRRALHCARRGGRAGLGGMEGKETGGGDGSSVRAARRSARARSGGAMAEAAHGWLRGTLADVSAAAGLSNKERRFAVWAAMRVSEQASRGPGPTVQMIDEVEGDESPSFGDIRAIHEVLYQSKKDVVDLRDRMEALCSEVVETRRSGCTASGADSDEHGSEDAEPIVGDVLESGLGQDPRRDILDNIESRVRGLEHLCDELCADVGARRDMLAKLDHKIACAERDGATIVQSIRHVEEEMRLHLKRLDEGIMEGKGMFDSLDKKFRDLSAKSDVADVKQHLKRLDEGIMDGKVGFDSLDRKLRDLAATDGMDEMKQHLERLDGCFREGKLLLGGLDEKLDGLSELESGNSRQIDVLASELRSRLASIDIVVSELKTKTGGRDDACGSSAFVALERIEDLEQQVQHHVHNAAVDKRKLACRLAAVEDRAHAGEGTNHERVTDSLQAELVALRRDLEDCRASQSDAVDRAFSCEIEERERALDALRAELATVRRDLEGQWKTFGGEIMSVLRRLERSGPHGPHATSAAGGAAPGGGLGLRMDQMQRRLTVLEDDVQLRLDLAERDTKALLDMVLGPAERCPISQPQNREDGGSLRPSRSGAAPSSSSSRASAATS